MNTEAYREKIKSIDHAIEWHAEELKAWQRVKAEAETNQAEAEKPGFVEPKHLDYGLYQFGDNPPIKAIYINMSFGIPDTTVYLKEESVSGALYASCALQHGHFTAIHGNLRDLKPEQEAAK